MAIALINKYIWLIDTIERHGPITLKEISTRWENNRNLSNGEALNRRTFFNYKNGIFDVFGIEIVVNKSTFEYSISTEGSDSESRMREWLLDSMSISGMLNDSTELSGRILLEDVPSARTNLPTMLQAMKEYCRVKFSYLSYDSIRPHEGVVIEPYFVKIFKQLWYVIGRNVADNKIKTYALDRMTKLQILNENYEMPEDFEPEEFFRNYYGITTSRGGVKTVIVKATSKQAKYIRALPLHRTQQEEILDGYSLFYYQLVPTYDFLQVLLSYGMAVEVIAPRTLRLQVVEHLKALSEMYAGEMKE